MFAPADEDIHRPQDFVEGNDSNETTRILLKIVGRILMPSVGSASSFVSLAKATFFLEYMSKVMPHLR
jgi:hypothetical protein